MSIIMDSNQPQSEEKKDETSPQAQPKPKLKLPINMPKMYLNKPKLPNLKEKFTEYARVLKVTKKPDSDEFKTIVKASGLGIIIIGVIGFIIAIIASLIQMI